MSAPTPSLEQQIATDIEETARRDPRGTWLLLCATAAYLAALLVYLLVQAVSGHNPLAAQYLAAIAAAVSPLATFLIGVLVPSPIRR